jgi:outer membrane lipoprotein LolB
LREGTEGEGKFPTLHPSPLCNLALFSVDSRRHFLNNPSVRSLFILLLLTLLAACATAPERAPVDDVSAAWRARQSTLAPLQAWELRGRIGGRNGEESFQASLLWKRDGERHRIELAGPLGGGRVRLTQDKNGAELRDGEDHVYRDVSAQRLLRRATGWSLPLEHLNYWALGLPASEPIARSELDDWGRLTLLVQQGWEIRFLDYTTVGAYELPSRVFIKREVSGDATLDVRLVIEKWSVAEPAPPAGSK